MLSFFGKRLRFNNLRRRYHPTTRKSTPAGANPALSGDPVEEAHVGDPGYRDERLFRFAHPGLKSWAGARDSLRSRPPEGTFPVSPETGR